MATKEFNKNLQKVANSNSIKLLRFQISRVSQFFRNFGFIVKPKASMPQYISGLYASSKYKAFGLYCLHVTHCFMGQMMSQSSDLQTKILIICITFYLLAKVSLTKVKNLVKKVQPLNIHL